MPLLLLHPLACLAVVVAAVYWLLRHRKDENSHLFFLPFVTVTFGAALQIQVLLLQELFVAWYSGAIYEFDAMMFRFNGPYWWAYVAGAILPLMPGLGLIPFVGRRPALVASLALIGLMPFIFRTLSP